MNVRYNPSAIERLAIAMAVVSDAQGYLYAAFQRLENQIAGLEFGDEQFENARSEWERQTEELIAINLKNYSNKIEGQVEVETTEEQGNSEDDETDSES